MSIVKRTIYMAIFTAVALFLLAYFVSNYAYLKGFQNLENKAVQKNSLQVAGALSVKMEGLVSFCQDWASSDDTYYFALNHDQMYIDKNLKDETFVGSNFNLLVVLDTRGAIVYGKNYDIINEQEIALPADLLDALSSQGLIEPVGLQSSISGIIIISAQTMLVVSRPILTSLDEGPSAGTLIIGRFVDAGLINDLSKTTSLSINLLSMEDVNQNPDLNGVIGALNIPDSVYVKVQNSKSIAGYTLFSDLNGNPAFVFKVTIPRDIYSQGVDFVTYVHIAQLVVCIVFCIICILLVKNLVLTRLTALSGAVNEIGLKGDMSSRVTVSGKDELSRLAKNINGMLESLEKSESRRESQKELIGHIITNTPVAVLAVDGADSIVLFNDALISMFDLTDIDMFNKKVADIPRLSILIPEINSFKNSGAASSIGELTYVLDGINRTAIASFARLHEEETYILLLTDISEERARQETLYMTDRLASIGEMASGIAHELNNPLTSIIGLSEIIAMENVPDTVKEDMNIIKSESQRAADIVKNLLSFGRKNTSQKQPMAVNKIIQDVLRLRSYEHGVNNIKVIKELATDLPDIMADPSQIQQVIINLVLNAEQAMISAHDKGTITIRTQKVDNLVRITFSDDGPGIEPENLRHIFDPFFTTKETGKGTGLGLSISYGIVNEHNGKIYASSEPGKGATFVVELPLNDVGKKV